MFCSAVRSSLLKGAALHCRRRARNSAIAVFRNVNWLIIYVGVEDAYLLPYAGHVSLGPESVAFNPAIHEWGGGEELHTLAVVEGHLQCAHVPQ